MTEPVVQNNNELVGSRRRFWMSKLKIRQRTDIIIKPADKGGAVVVWSRELYNQEAHRQLSDNQAFLLTPRC